MSVIAIKKRWEREATAESQRNGLLYEVIGRRYQVEWDVYTNNHFDGTNRILIDPATPKIGEVYSFGNDNDIVATLVRLQPKATSNKKLWRLVGEFDTDRVISFITDNPLNQPPEISWDFATYERPLVRDTFGTPIVSSSGTYIDPPIMVEDVRPILRIIRNEPSFHPGNILPYEMMLNQKPFLGAPPLYSRINYIKGDRKFINGIFFHQVMYEIEFRKESFVRWQLDNDFRDIDGRIFYDIVSGSPLQNPTPLNGRGRSLFKSISYLADSLTNDPTNDTVIILPDDVAKFPPGPRPAMANGIIPGPHWYFQIKVDDEIMNVQEGFNTDTFIVKRGYGGSLVAAHSVDAKVTLEPYYLRFIPHQVGSYTPLDLPVVP